MRQTETLPTCRIPLLWPAQGSIMGHEVVEAQILSAPSDSSAFWPLYECGHRQDGAAQVSQARDSSRNSLRSASGAPQEIPSQRCNRGVRDGQGLSGAAGRVLFSDTVQFVPNHGALGEDLPLRDRRLLRLG